MKKGDVVRGTGSMGLCSARVTGIGRVGVRVMWLEGVLAGREGLVPRDMLRASGDRLPLPGYSEPSAPEANDKETT